MLAAHRPRISLDLCDQVCHPITSSPAIVIACDTHQICFAYQKQRGSSTRKVHLFCLGPQWGMGMQSAWVGTCLRCLCTKYSLVLSPLLALWMHHTLADAYCIIWSCSLGNSQLETHLLSVHGANLLLICATDPDKDKWGLILILSKCVLHVCCNGHNTSQE